MVEGINPDIPPEGVESSKRTRVITQTKYPLPDSRTDFNPHHLKIISSYASSSPNGSKELKYSDFSEIILGFNPQYVSGINKFLENIGLISSCGGGKYKPTQDCIDFYNSYKWDKIDDAKKILKKRLMETWFWTETKTLIELNKTVAREGLIQHLGHIVGADPDKHKSSLGTLVEYLLYASLIKLNEETGEIKLSDGNGTMEPPITEEIIEEKSIRGKIAGEKIIKPEILPKNQINVDISIEFIISPDMNVEDIKTKVEALIEALRTY